MPAKPNLPRAARHAILEGVLVFLGIVFVHREIWQLRASTFQFDYWQQIAVLILALVDGSISGAFGSSYPNVQNKPAYTRFLRWAGPMFLVLYVGCSALSQRLTVAFIAGELIRTFGIAVCIVGILIRVWAHSNTPSLFTKQAQEGEDPGQPKIIVMPTGPHKYIRYPDAAGRLIALLGLPLVFNTWLPLIALPGIMVLLKWHISDQEAFRISQLGESYVQYKKQTWNLVPFIY